MASRGSRGSICNQLENPKPRRCADDEAVRALEGVVELAGLWQEYSCSVAVSDRVMRLVDPSWIAVGWSQEEQGGTRECLVEPSWLWNSIPIPRKCFSMIFILVAILVFQVSLCHSRSRQNHVCDTRWVPVLLQRSYWRKHLGKPGRSRAAQVPLHWEQKNQTI